MRKKLIVIAEDSLTQAGMLTFILEDLGFSVMHGENGKKALELVQKHIPSLLISDIMMPEMDGYELCRAVKSDTKLNHIPVLLLTTLSTPKDLLTGLAAGADSYLIKPYEETDLANWVEKLIDPPESGDPSVSQNLENFLVSTYQIALKKNEELKDSQQQLKELNQHLKRKVAEQTQNLLEEIDERKSIELELKKSKEIAQQADRLKTAFLNNLSHEIRTPMNAILGFSNFIVDPGVSTEDKIIYSSYVTSGCNNLLGIIDSIVDLAVIESENIKPTLKECKLNVLLASIRDEFSETINLQKDNLLLRLTTDNKNDDFTILTDAARVKQIITNLLKNSVKFTETGYIEFGYVFTKAGYIDLFVRDTGIGIPADKMDTVFDKFTKLDEFHPRTYSGAGVGLTITKKLVEFLGGDIYVESIVNKGSVFTLSIPMEIPKSQDGPKTNVGQPIEKAVYNWSDKLIVVAEDVESNFLLIEHQLKRTNARLLWAKNGKEAVDLCSNGRKIDLVLMDIQMPVMDGYAAAEEITKLGKGIPIVAQTAYALSSDDGKIKGAGFTDLLSKPIKISELMQKITFAFNKSSFH